MQVPTCARLVLFLAFLVPAAAQGGKPAVDAKQLRSEARAAVQAGDFDAAIAGWRTLTEADGKDGEAWHMLGYALHMAGKLDEALPVHEKASGFPRVGQTAAYNAACVHALKGRAEPAFQWLEKAVSLGFDRAEHLRNDPDFDGLRNDPRYGKLLLAIEALAAAGDGGAPQAFEQVVPRRNARVAWFDKKGSPGQVSLDYAPVRWNDKLGEGLASGKFVGKKWRLGADFWTRLDTSVDLVLGGVPVPAGYYYVTAEQRDAKTFLLALHDPVAVKKLRLDAYQAERLQGGIEIPLVHEAAAASSELAIKLALDEGSADHGTLAIHFGGNQLRAPFVAVLGK